MTKVTAKYNNNFIEIPLNQNNVYVYSVRRTLQKALDLSLSKFSGTLVDLGCGEMPYKQYIIDHNKKVDKYIGVDVGFNPTHQIIKPDLLWNGKKIPLKNNSVNTLIATELFEHIPNIEAVLVEINRVLKADGLLYFTVPFIWPLHEVPYDEYRYTPYSLHRHFANAGFKKIEIYPLGGHHTALAQIICIWYYNILIGSQNNLFRPIINNLIFYLIKLLINKDDLINTTNYGENSIQIGFYGYAKK